MQAFGQGDERAAAAARLDVGDDLAAVQPQRRENGQGAGQGAVAHTFVVAPHTGVPAGLRAGPIRVVAVWKAAKPLL